MNSAPGFISASSRRLIILRLSSAQPYLDLTTSEPASSSSSSTNRTPSASARSGVGLNVQATTSMPSAFASRATSRPTFPVPIRPRRLALQEDVLHARPSSRLQLGRLERHPLGGCEHQRHDVLADDGRDPTGLVADDNPQLGRRLQVDHVRPDRARGDHPQIGQGLQRGPEPLDRAPGVDDDLGALDAPKLLLHRVRPVVCTARSPYGSSRARCGESCIWIGSSPGTTNSFFLYLP